MLVVCKENLSQIMRTKGGCIIKKVGGKIGAIACFCLEQPVNMMILRPMNKF